MFKRGLWWCLLAWSGVLLGGPAQAVSLQYEASDLPDLVAGQDRWSYHYLLSGSFAAFEGVNLLYPADRYADLALVAAPDPGAWPSLITPPDPLLGADGLLGLMALTAINPVQLPFTLEFTWLLDHASPGAQGFEVFEDGFNVIASGNTTPLAAPGIPEPGSLPLLAGALGLLAWRQRRC